MISKKMSLRSKLKFFMLITLAPMFILVLYLLFQLRVYTEKYVPIVEGVNIASEFDRHFKEEVDYMLYRITIGSEKYEATQIEEKMQEAEGYIEQLKVSTALERNKKLMNQVQRNFTSLKNCIEKIRNNLSETGHYDENMGLLNNDVYVITTLITEEVREYVYYEALELEKVKWAIKKELNKLFQLCLVIFLLVIGITWFLVIGISNSISNPLMHLCEMIKQVETGDFSKMSLRGQGDEIKMLEMSFNHMLMEMELLVKDIKEEQNNLRLTELKLLQAQINPHFLYNTLDTIIWLAEDGQSEEVVELVTSLSQFFRVSLSKGRDYITIREEMQHVCSYLQIQKARYADFLTYEINISEEIRQYDILKLSLQPLVENALYHGIKQKRGQGKVVVTGWAEEENIYFVVSDNGKGMTEEQLLKVREAMEKKVIKKEGFGLANVNERIQLNYGKRYGLTIESVYEEGTRVTLCMPRIKN